MPPRFPGVPAKQSAEQAAVDPASKPLPAVPAQTAAAALNQSINEITALKLEEEARVVADAEAADQAAASAAVAAGHAAAASAVIGNAIVPAFADVAAPAAPARSEPAEPADPPGAAADVEEPIPGPLVYAPHWYDGVTLFNKRFHNWNVNVLSMMRGLTTVMESLHLGETSIHGAYVDSIRGHRGPARGLAAWERYSATLTFTFFDWPRFTQQIGMIKREGLELVGTAGSPRYPGRAHPHAHPAVRVLSIAFVGPYPCIIGETGIPFDLEGGAAYRSNDYRDHVRATVYGRQRAGQTQA